MHEINTDEIEQEPDSINSFVIVGEFGFYDVEGPFSVDKEGTVWTITVPNDALYSPNILVGMDSNGVALHADCTVVGGGVIKGIEQADDTDEQYVHVDQYAMGEPDV